MLPSFWSSCWVFLKGEFLCLPQSWVLRINKIACLRSTAQDVPNMTCWQNQIPQLQDINVSTGRENSFFPFPGFSLSPLSEDAPARMIPASILSEEMGKAQVENPTSGPIYSHTHPAKHYKRCGRLSGKAFSVMGGAQGFRVKEEGR